MSDGIDAGGVTGADGAEDDGLMAELRAMADQHDPVPLEAVAAARSAIAWRTMDAELAELTADSSVSPQELAGVRGVGAPALLSFDAADVSVEFEVMEQPDGRRRLLGQLVPTGPGSVQIRHRGGSVSVVADEVGRFTAGDLPSGPLSLRCAVGDRIVETDWFLV